MQLKNKNNMYQKMFVFIFVNSYGALVLLLLS